MNCAHSAWLILVMSAISWPIYMEPYAAVYVTHAWDRSFCSTGEEETRSL